MNKVVLSAITAITIAATSASATQFYVDQNGQVFINPGEGRSKLDMGSASTVKTLTQEDKKEIAASIKKEIKDDFKLPFKRITIEDQSSPEFLLGKQTHINMKIQGEDNPDMWLKAGVRIQTTFVNHQIDYTHTPQNNKDYYDAYLRRTRFEVQAGWNKWVSFTMDVRNDKANYKDDGEGKFNVGDAYVKIKKPFGTSLVNFKLFRGKIDISRTETVKSARVINFDRPHVADEAAQYISHNRRGTNVAMSGDWKKKIHYQIAAGDGVQSGKFKDAAGNSFKGTNFEQRDFFYGGKIILSPFDGWEETQRTESYFGQGKHFQIGASYWRSPDINYKNTSGQDMNIDHELINLEASAHYKGFFAQAEYFKFRGVVQDWNTAKTGESTGWYATSEYVFENLGFIAPFVRYESWDRFNSVDGYDQKSQIVGVNWYLQGNSIKTGLTYQKDNYGGNLKGGERAERQFKWTTQFFF